MKEGNVVGHLKERTEPSARVAIAGSFLAALAVIVALEMMSLLVFRFAILPGDVRIYQEPDEKVMLSRLDDYLRHRDPLLGWPHSNWIKNYDATGARPSPAFPSPQGACVSLYGDSFTYGAEASHAEAWGNQLAEMLGCRVANYGVNGYGTDQALLRFQRNVHDEASLVILGIFHENIRRNVNQYRRYLTGADMFGFKPRFMLGADGLELVPLPVEHVDEIHLSLHSPERVLRHEWFLPGTDNGPLPATFPYSWGVLRAAISSEVWSRLSGWPSWAEFYDERHPSKALPLTRQLSFKFADLAAHRGKHAIILIFPAPASYHLFKREGINIAAPLIQPLADRGILVIDLLPALRGQLMGRSYCEITSQPNCHGHYSAEGLAMVAAIVFAEISRMFAGSQAEVDFPIDIPTVEDQRECTNHPS